MRRGRARAFTLLEVMLALAILGFALVVLIKSVAGSIYASQESQMMGIATDLARGKMYDIEEGLMKDGLSDTSSCGSGAFETEGFPAITWSQCTIVPTMPPWDELQKIAKGQMGSGSAYGSAFGGGFGSAFGSGSGFGSGSAFGSGITMPYNFGSGSEGDLINTFGSDNPMQSFQNSQLGLMLDQISAASLGGKGGVAGMMGSGGLGSDAASSAGGLMIQQYYSQVQDLLKDSIRKVKLTVTWKVGSEDQSMDVVAFFIDPVQMDKVLQGLGATDIDGSGSGSGSSTGSGSASTTKSTTSTSLGTH